MKRKLTYLFSLMLLCVLGTGKMYADTVTATWDFTGTPPTPETLTSVSVQNRAAFYPSDNDVAALYVDALNGKLAYVSDGYAQFNQYTVLRVPVYSVNDIVTVTSYPGQYNFTIGGIAATSNTTVHTATSSEVTKGYVEIVATNTAYLNSITLQTNVITSKHAAWNFLNEIPSTIHGVSIQNTTGNVASSVSGISLDVDASSSKFQARGTDAWFTAGTILKVPVANEGDVVTIMAYSTSYDNYTIGGVDASGSDSPIYNYIASSSDAENGYVSIVATNDSYIYALAVLQAPDKESSSPLENFTLSYIGVDGSTVIDTQSVEDGQTIGTFAVDIDDVAASQSGYKARGWFKSNAVGEKYTTSSVVTSNINLYAIETEIEVAEEGTTFNYDLTKSYFYAEDHELFSATNGSYYNNHGWSFGSNSSFSVGVAGPAQITLTLCQYGTAGAINVTDANGNDVGTIVSSQSSSDGGTIAFNYNGDATTLTFAFESTNVYLHGVTVYNIDTSLASYTVTFKNGETTVDTYTVYDGSSVGTLPSDPNTDSNKQFIGWYTAIDGTGTEVTSDVVPTADVTYYANILDITTNNGYVVVDNSGNDGRNGESFKAAIAWANANSGYNVFVPNGTYDLGDQISSTISGVTITRAMSIIGESMEGVLIKAETEKENESINTTVIKIDGSVTGAYLQNVTVQNYPKAYNTTTNAERALALWDRGTQTVLKNVYLKGTQDVYYTNSSNGKGQLTYYEGGKVEGTVDFICGLGTVFFESVALHAASSATYAAAHGGKASTTYIAAPATYDDEVGYVFNNSKITGEADQAGKYYLVRTWQNAAKTTFIDVDYSACAPIADLYKTMNDQTTLDNCHSYSSSDAEAANYTATAVLGSTFYNSAKSTIATYSNDVIVGSTGFATVGFPYATTIPNNVTAYAITGLNGSTLTTTKITAGSTVAANTGLLISAAEGTYTFAARPDGTEYSDNILVATGSETPSFNSEGQIYFLTITDTTNKKVGWKLNNAGRTLKKYSAYIPATSIPTSLSVLSFTTDDATAIDGVVEQSEFVVAPAYNVAGQRVNANVKGIVIIDGKKVVNE